MCRFYTHPVIYYTVFFYTHRVYFYTQEEQPSLPFFSWSWSAISVWPNKSWFTLFCREIRFVFIYALLGVKKMTNIRYAGVFICCRTVSLHQAGDLTCWIAIFQIWGGIVSNVLCSHTGDFFPSHLRTFLLNFVATGVYALSLKILKSLPAVFFPFLVWAKFWVPPLPRIWSWDIVFDSRDHYFWYSRTQGFSKIYHMYGFWGCIAL